jgi:DNA-binding winged helix-turn-helix (wHTH) protein
MLSPSSSLEEVADAERYSVRDLLVEVDTRRVLRGGEEVHLTELSFDVLVVLLRRAPGVVSKRQLMKEVWQGLVIEPDTVKKRITLLRESLADGERQDPLIRVVRGRGYAINATVERLHDNSLDLGKKWRRPLTALSWLVLFALGLTLAAVMLLRDDAREQSTDFAAKPAAVTVGTGAPAAEKDPAISDADIDPLAYQLYIEGRMLRRTTNGLAEAITALERAIDIEPGFAAAYAELSLCKLTSSGRGKIDHRRSELDAARKLSQRALELDSQLPLAYAVASVVASVDWNWPGAEALLQKGLSISPDDEYLLAYQSRMASIRGDIDKAFSSLDLAYTLHDSELIKIITDPLLDSIRDDPRYVELLARMKLD